MKKILSKNLILTFAVTSFMIMIYMLIRLLFLLSDYNYLSDLSSGEIILSFIRGIRFDASGYFYSNFVFIILFNFPYVSLRYKIYDLILYILFIAWNLFILFGSIADIGYFASTGRRLTYEIFTMKEDVLRMFPSLITTHYIFFIIYIFMMILFVWLLRKLYFYIYDRINIKRNLYTEIFGFIFIIIFSILTIRGGFQLKPVRQADAFLSDKSSTGYLTLNTTFNIMRSIFQISIPEINIVEKNTALEITRNIIRDSSETFLSPDYTFLRKRDFTPASEKPNIVIFIMESWSAKYNSSISGGKSYTPFFDSLAGKSIVFTRFIANGQRSIEAVPSITASVPSLYNESLIGSKSEITKFRGLASILNENGYHTAFHHGATTGSMGFDSYTRIAGFEKYFGKEDYTGPSQNADDGTWGIYDEPFFLDAGEKMNLFQKPFCSVIFSLSSHDPFHLPDDKKWFKNIYKGEAELDIAIRYSDYALQKFFEKVSQYEWFDNTIFFITADHTLYNSRIDFFNTYHIPLLIYSPKYLQPAVINDISSQTDILPGIIELLKINSPHSSMGKSLFSKNKYAFVKFSEYYCIISNEYVLVSNLNDYNKLYDYNIDLNLTKDLSLEHSEIASEMKQKLYSYVQETINAVRNNKIYIDMKTE